MVHQAPTGEEIMRSFQITFFDRDKKALSTHLVVGLTRGNACQQARMMMRGARARYEIEEI